MLDLALVVGRYIDVAVLLRERLGNHETANHAMHRISHHHSSSNQLDHIQVVRPSRVTRHFTHLIISLCSDFTHACSFGTAIWTASKTMCSFVRRSMERTLPPPPDRTRRAARNWGRKTRSAIASVMCAAVPTCLRAIKNNAKRMSRQLA